MGETLKYQKNQFYWDDMKHAAFRGIYNPNEDWNGWLLPYLSLGEVMRLQKILDSDHENNPETLRIKFVANMSMAFYSDPTEDFPGGYYNLVEPIRFENRLWYAVHEGWTWMGWELHDNRTN
jgi:hypothetical protein